MATVVLTNCANSFEAELVKGNLNANGIECILQGENASIFEAGIGAQSGFGVNVLIEESDIDAAKEIIGK